MRLIAVLALALTASLAQDEEQIRRYFDTVHEAMALNPGAAVADVGSGDDPARALRIAGRVGPAGRVVCVDIDRKALEKLKQSLPAGQTNIETHLGKPDDPLLPAASLDAVLVAHAYHDMSEPAAVLRHLRRALKPGGRLVVIEAITKGREARARDEQTANHELSPELLQRELAAAGFRVIGAVRPLLTDGGTLRYLVAAEPGADTSPVRD